MHSVWTVRLLDNSPHTYLYTHPPRHIHIDSYWWQMWRTKQTLRLVLPSLQIKIWKHLHRSIVLLPTDVIQFSLVVIVAVVSPRISPQAYGIYPPVTLLFPSQWRSVKFFGTSTFTEDSSKTLRRPVERICEDTLLRSNSRNFWSESRMVIS